MRKLSLILAILMLIPSAIALDIDMAKHTHLVPMQTQFITQGYEYARVQGMNKLDKPIIVEHWHLNAELGPMYARCEMEPATLQPGPFDVEIVVQCQTRSGFTNMYPKGTIVTLEGFTKENPLEGTHNIDKIWIEAKPTVPTPFPITRVTGGAVLEEAGSTAGSFMFIAGICAIAIIAIAVVLLAMRKEE